MTAPEWLDGFDQYNDMTDFLNGNYTSQASFSISTLFPRTGNKSLRIAQSGFREVTKTITGRTSYYVGCAIAPNTITGNTRHGLYIKSATGALFGLEIGLNGFINLYYNNVIVWTDTEQKAFIGPYFYYEYFVDITAGEIEFKFNGSATATVNVSGLAPVASTLNLFNIRSQDTAGTGTYYDDLYIHPTSYLGAQRCYTQFVDGDAAPQDWVGILAPNFNNLNDVPYSAANYIQGTAVNDKSQFNYADIVSTAALVTVNGARLCTVQSQDISGTSETQAAMIVDGITFLGAQRTQTTSPVFYNDMLDIGGYTLAQVNAGETYIEKMV